MRLLILGSTGTVGTAVEEVCKSRGIESISLSHNEFSMIDSDFEALLAGHAPTVVFNGVAQIADRCEIDPSHTMDINAVAVYRLANACKKNRVTLIQPSSHSVFDGNKQTPYVESDLPNPFGVYAVSKLASEAFARAAPQHYIVRFPTLFGPRRNTSLGFVDKMIERMKQGQPLRIADDKIDSPTYTIDAAERVLDLASGGAEYGLYHIANKGTVSYYDFISHLASKLNYHGIIERAKSGDFPSPFPKPLRTAMTSERTAPMRRWEEALDAYVSLTKSFSPSK